MDVRCDRCQTEYELDDDSVADAGASVQCTTCGHTFIVTRGGAPLIAAVTPPGGVDFSSPSAPDWVLATEEGRTHRFRDLTTLQKWVVERRVTRNDRVSQRGGPWRRLDDIDELQPFFEVVEQADHARAADAARRPTEPATLRRPVPAPRPRAAADPDEDVLETGRAARAAPLRTDELIDTSLTTDDDLAAAGLNQRRRLIKIGVGAGMVGLAVLAAWLGFKDPHGFRSASPPASPPAAQAAARPPAPSAPAAPVAAAPPPAAAGPPAAVARPPAPPPAAPAPAHAEEPADLAGDLVKPGARAAAAADARPKTYERLVAEADHALENGATTRAQKLYDEALKLQPDGVAAITGSAYLLLDRQRPLAAIGLFKRALTSAPTFPPALFGLGEAYRSQGDNQHALDAYKKYLAAAPTGQDAPAARRQIRDLGEAAPAPRVDTTAPSGESAKMEPPPAASAPPPGP